MRKIYLLFLVPLVLVSVYISYDWKAVLFKELDAVPIVLTGDTKLFSGFILISDSDTLVIIKDSHYSYFDNMKLRYSADTPSQLFTYDETKLSLFTCWYKIYPCNFITQHLDNETFLVMLVLESFYDHNTGLLDQRADSVRWLLND